MTSSYRTRSSTRALEIQSTSQPTTAHSESSPTSSSEVEDLFNGSTPTLTPPASHSNMNQGNRELLPHQPENQESAPNSLLPTQPENQNSAPNQHPPNQNLLDAISQLVQLMIAQFQTMPPQLMDQAHNPRTGPPRSRVKTHDPDPYDGTDPSKLRAFLSQCRLAFLS